MTADIQGTWFPSGYYGHYRSKSRTDFVCEYRHLAKPQPPRKFLHRAREQPRRHVFSHHDNRQAFLNDALIFQQGLGKRRVPNSTYQFKNDFIAWMPEREYVERSRPLASTYKQDFNPNDTKAQKIIKRPKTSFEGVPTTSYRYSHGNEAPNKQVINAMNNEALMLTLLNRKDGSMSSARSGRESVASCLTWVSHKSVQKPPLSIDMARPVIPLATQTTEFVPHPPSQPKPPSPKSSPSTAQHPTWPEPQAPPQNVQAMPPPVQAPPPTQNEPMAQ